MKFRATVFILLLATEVGMAVSLWRWCASEFQGETTSLLHVLFTLMFVMLAHVCIYLAAKLLVFLWDLTAKPGRADDEEKD